MDRSDNLGLLLFCTLVHTIKFSKKKKGGREGGRERGREGGGSIEEGENVGRMRKEREGGREKVARLLIC